MENYTKYFINKQRRDGGELITVLTDNAPIELKTLIHEIHKDYFGDCLPSDWIYQTIYEAFSALSLDHIDNINIEADCYDKDLIEWLYTPCATNYCDEVLEEGYGETKNFMGVVSQAQFKAKEDIYWCVNRFLLEVVQ